METVTIPKSEFEQMQRKIKLLTHSQIYKRLLEFERNITKTGKFTRKDLGF